jgi:hypothetical protein
LFFGQKYKFFAKVDIFATVDSMQKLLNKKVDWHEWHYSQYTNMSILKRSEEEEEEEEEGDL